MEVPDATWLWLQTVSCGASWCSRFKSNDWHFEIFNIIIPGSKRDIAPCKSVCSWCDGSSDRSFMGWTHSAISRSSQCSTTGVTKAVVCAILSVG